MKQDLGQLINSSLIIYLDMLLSYLLFLCLQKYVSYINRNSISGFENKLGNYMETNEDIKHITS